VVRGQREGHDSGARRCKAVPSANRAASVHALFQCQKARRQPTSTQGRERGALKAREANSRETMKGAKGASMANKPSSVR